MIGRIFVVAVAAVAMSGTAFAQDADHPKDKTLVVGSDFGVAPWMVRGASGPEGFGVDMIKDGSLTASGMQQPYLMGQKAGGAMLDHLAGKNPPKNIVVPVVVVSKDNLDQELPVITQTVFGGETK